VDEFREQLNGYRRSLKGPKEGRKKVARKKKALIVEDDEIVCLVIGKIAEMHGVEVTIARNGKEAREALQKVEDFDILFLDLLLPYVSGWEVLDTVTSHPRTKDMPVVIVTGARISTKEKKKLLGKATAIVDKQTFSLAQFEKVLDELLQEKRQV